MDYRRTSTAEFFTMVVNRTADIANWLNTMRTFIFDKDTSITEWAVKRQQHEAEKEKRRVARETEREELTAAEPARNLAKSEQ